MVNKVRMRETFCELVSIYAASKKEREVCDYLKCKLKDLGASIIVEDSAGEKNGRKQRKPHSDISGNTRRTSVNCNYGTHGLR